MLWPLVLIGAVIFVVVMLLNRDGRTLARRGDPMALTPFEILRQRFARGEINQAEYEEKRRVILRG